MSGKMRRTARGQLIDMDALRSKNANKKAVSNVNINARGDYMDNSGKVVKSRESIVSDYNKANKGSGVRHVPLNQIKKGEFADMLANTEFKTASEAMEEVKANKRRKLIEKGNEEDGTE